MTDTDQAPGPATTPSPPQRLPRVAVLGATDIVSHYLGARLAHFGAETTLIGCGSRLAELRKNGVPLMVDKKVVAARPFCTNDYSEVGFQDYVIVTLGARSAHKAVDAMQPALGPGTVVVTAHTGMPWWYFYRLGGEFDGHRLESVDPDGRLWNEIGPDRAIGCVLDLTVAVGDGGALGHSGNGIALGEPSGEETKRVATLARHLTEAGLNASVESSIRNRIWDALWGSVGFDPISVLTTTPPATIAKAPGTRALARALMVEAEEVGKALGVDFGNGLAKHFKLAAADAGRTSLLTDLRAGRQLELDAVGTVVQEMGRLVDIDTPALDMVLALTRQRAEEEGLYTPPPEKGALGKALAVGEGAKDAAFVAAGAVIAVPGKVGGFVADLVGEIGKAMEWVFYKAAPLGQQVTDAASNAVAFVGKAGREALTTDLTRDLNEMLGQLEERPPTYYDGTMDPDLGAGTGFGLQRVCDGGHTLWGAYKSVTDNSESARDASTDDGIVARSMGMTLGLFPDAATAAGLPFFAWDGDTRTKVGTQLKDRFGIPKRFFSALAKYDAAEIFAGLTKSVAILFRWSPSETRDFVRIAVNSGVLAVVKRNPILGVVSISAMARTFMDARKTGEYGKAAKALAAGAVVKVAPMVVVRVLVAASGPAAVALVTAILAGMTATLLAKKAGDSENVDEMARCFADLTVMAADEVKKRLDGDREILVSPALPESTADSP